MSALYQLRKALSSGTVSVFPPLRVEGLAVEMNLGSADEPRWAPLSEDMAANFCNRLGVEPTPALAPRQAPVPLTNRLKAVLKAKAESAPSAELEELEPLSAPARTGSSSFSPDVQELAEALAAVLTPLLTRKVIRTVERDKNGLIARIIETTE